LNIAITTGSPLNPVERAIVEGIKEGFSDPKNIGYVTADIAGDAAAVGSMVTGAAGVFPSPFSPELLAASQSLSYMNMGCDVLKVALAPDADTRRSDMLKLGFSSLSTSGSIGLIKLSRWSTGTMSLNADIHAEGFIQLLGISSGYAGSKLIDNRTSSKNREMGIILNLMMDGYYSDYSEELNK